MNHPRAPGQKMISIWIFTYKLLLLRELKHHITVPFIETRLELHTEEENR